MHLGDAHENSIHMYYVSHGTTADTHLGANSAYESQPIYANQHQSYSSLSQQPRSSGFSNQLPYNLPVDFVDSKLEHPIYYNAKQDSYLYPKQTITILPTLHIPSLPSYASSAYSYQSHHPADVQNIDVQPSYYPSIETKSVLTAHNSGYASGSNDRCIGHQL